MKASNFRIGNLVEEPKGYTHRIERIDEESNRVRHGLKLTETHLKYFGFEFKPEGEEVYDQIWDKDNFRIWQHSEGFCYELSDTSPLDFVHQLQNLYFAITGKELTGK